ncbi:MAG: ABC transporter ATP-binding protein [Cyanophyceae cyanobacterium]
MVAAQSSLTQSGSSAQLGSSLLTAEDLTIEIPTRAGLIYPVNQISFTLEKKQTLAILGESGSGKSMLLKTILGIQPSKARVKGTLEVSGTNVLSLSPREREEFRGSKVAMIFQNPMTAMDPVFTVEYQIVETLRRHTPMTQDEAEKRALELMELVQIPSPKQRLKSYPFEMSGGMRQRVVIAMALACNPDLLLADEPTTALDVTVQAKVLDLLKELQQQLGMSIIIVTHDVGVAAAIADEIAVMYAGRILEKAPVRKIFEEPAHPYTMGLLEANVRPGQKERPRAIPGLPPNLARLPQGCSFVARCDRATESCWSQMPTESYIEPDHRARCLLLAG